MPIQQNGFYCPQCRAKRLFTKQTTNHILHLLATVFLCGFWLPIWFLIAITESNPYHCTQCGYGDTYLNLASPKFCPVCNQPVRHEDSSCRHCKAAFSNTQKAARWLGQNNNAWKVGVGACAVILFGMVGFAVTEAFRDSKPTATAALPKTEKASAFQNNNVVEKSYEKLTYQSTYKDIINILGEPDREVSSFPPEAKIPNTMLYYKESNYVVFVVYEFKGRKIDKSKSHYLGTKGLNPEKVLHVSNERNRVLIDAYKFGQTK